MGSWYSLSGQALEKSSYSSPGRLQLNRPRELTILPDRDSGAALRPPPHVPINHPTYVLTDGLLLTSTPRPILASVEGRTSWRRLIARLWLQDPQLCPACGHPTKILCAINSPHQDEVIERILRHRGQWDPPWTRQRRARAPPPQDDTIARVLDEELSQIPPEDEEDLSQDLLDGDEPR